MESYLSLRRFTGPLTDAEETALETILERMPAGTASKRTYRRRFSALDDILAAEIDRRFEGHISVHDMAASTAVTSLELYRLLSKRRPVTMRASDHYDAVDLVHMG